MNPKGTNFKGNYIQQQQNQGGCFQTPGGRFGPGRGRGQRNYYQQQYYINNRNRIQMILMLTIQRRLVILVVTICYHHRLNYSMKIIIAIISNHISYKEDLVGEMNVTTIAIFVTIMDHPTITKTQIIIPPRRQETY